MKVLARFIIFIISDRGNLYGNDTGAGISMHCSAITGPVFRNHDCRGHAECHDRLLAVLKGLPDGLAIHEPVAASRTDLARVHPPGYLSWLEQQCKKHADTCMLDEYRYTGSYLEHNTLREGFIDPNTYINPCSYEVATFAAGSAIAATERALAGEPCFALVRPPGHHAEADCAMGFCLLNNAAVAAASALRSVDRVAIIDWDAHHGNGTQKIFYADNRVLYCSVHQTDIFPHTGFLEETGARDGKGYTINVPLPARSAIGEYHAVFSEIFVPALRRFDPGLVIISAGQDILSDDPLGSMLLTPPDIGILMSLVRGAGDVPLALVLEGGYGPSHADAIRCIFHALEGRPEPSRAAGQPGKKTRTTIGLIKKLHGLP